MRKNLLFFYEFLMECQRSGRRFTVREAAAATGYEESSITTNISKHLKGRWVDAIDGKRFQVHDFEKVSPSLFAEAMSQNTRLSFVDEREWRSQVTRLLGLGVQSGFPVAEVVKAVLEDVLPPEKK
jgi:hypothetical protein